MESDSSEMFSLFGAIKNVAVGYVSGEVSVHEYRATMTDLLARYDRLRLTGNQYERFDRGRPIGHAGS